MAAVAKMEFAGVPIDASRLDLLRSQWSSIKGALIAEIDKDYGVYEGTTFKMDKFEAYIERAGIPWPRTPTGRLATSDRVFREKAKSCPAIAPLRELRSSLAELRLSDLQVGRDGRNRALLSPYSSRTGRNQPSNSKFIFGPSVWLRGLIKPAPGHGVAYIDYSQQEFGIAAALSGDPDMLAAYTSGDPYLEFARQSGAVPRDATKETHGPQRELHKQCVLAVQYGMEAKSLAERLGQPKLIAVVLLDAHHQTYRKFWRWSDRVANYATLAGRLWTVFGWQLFTAQDPNPRSWRNFPMQANGAEMLRLAICLMTEAGIEVCAPVHDAVLIGAPLNLLDEHITIARRCMAEASKVVLSGFEIRTDVKVVKHPERFSDPRGVIMWDRVMKLLGVEGG
jgi:DNA polymerase I-like protein with 3'-5' exonuclease and polymerase domains